MALMSEKIAQTAPYNIFYNSIAEIEETHNHKNFITFSDLLCPSLGNLKYSVQITNNIEIDWLLDEYEMAGYRDIQLRIIYSNADLDVDAYMENNPHPNVIVKMHRSSDPYGKHHSKLGIYVYDDDSLRVVVLTANADRFSWTKYNEMIWVSPLCKPLAPNSKESDPTQFKHSLLQYLKNYPNDIMQDCINYVGNADFSDVKVCLVTTVPGSHCINNYHSECHLERMAELLSKHFRLPSDEVENRPWPILTLASSIGCIGEANNFFVPAVLRSFDSHMRNVKPRYSNAVAKVIYPSKQNVLDGIINDSNPERHVNFFVKDYAWMQNMLCSWKSDKLHLTEIMPRGKCYCRISPDNKKLGWFLLTTANLTKSALGGRIIKQQHIYARSYEVGILFLPKFFGKEYFEIDGETEPFPLQFDLPLSPYKYNEEPYNQCTAFK